jgi:hypothetical protein
MSIDAQVESLSPEVAYRFFYKQLCKYPEAEKVLKEALLLPGSTPESIAKSSEEFAAKRGEPFPDYLRVFIIKALKHAQFLAQVEAGTYEGEEGGSNAEG